MIYEYELACKEAGLSEEKIKEIRRMFDAEKKKLKRRKTAHDKSNLGFFTVEELAVNCGEGIDALEIPDPNTDIEMDYIRKCDIEYLKKLLNEMNPRDKEFILDCYSSKYGSESLAAAKYGMPRGYLRYQKEKIVEYLRGKFDI